MTPEALADLHARAAYPAGSAGWSAPWTASDFAQSLAAKGAVFVANAHGFALGRVTLDEAELLLIATDPAVRSKGHGRHLLTAFENEARARGAERAFLEVSRANAPALRLYHSSGWAQAGQRRKYYRLPNGTFEDAAIMTKTL